MKQNALALLAGALFALGLGLSGMTRPSKVIGFLDIAGDWDPSLALVMAAAVSVHFAAVRVVRRQTAGRPPRFPLFGGALAPPARTDVDASLVLGAALFGVGWGVAGYCPGPALVSLVTGSPAVLAFVVSMVAGMGLHHLTTRSRGAQASGIAQGASTKSV